MWLVFMDSYEDHPVSRLWNSVLFEPVEMRSHSVADRLQIRQNLFEGPSAVCAPQATHVFGHKPVGLFSAEYVNTGLIEASEVPQQTFLLPNETEVIAGKPERKSVDVFVGIEGLQREPNIEVLDSL